VGKIDWDSVVVKKLFLQGITGMNLSGLWRILVRNRFQVDRCYWDRLFYLFILACYNSVMARFEKGCNGEKIEATKITDPPVFIIGHWRSGTTHLHNLLGFDPHLACPTYYQVMFPHHFAYSQPWGMRIFNYLSPGKRPMDNMAVGARAPHEDEFALAALSTVSPYLQTLFPRTGDNGLAVLDPLRLDPEALDRWKEAMRDFVQKLTFSRGKRVVLKSPPHLGRVRVLLELFPGAKFIHINRNPYEVYLSTQHMWQTGFSLSHLQKPHPQKLEEVILTWYTELYALFARDRDLIPPGSLSEIKFEELVSKPLEVLKDIYETLGFPGFEEFRARVTPYLETQKSYKRNRYVLDDKTKESIRQRWGPTCAHYGYTLT
jgi:omega-hydroxy-beta-dihydromenaquinone-9 sulfotransferase